MPPNINILRLYSERSISENLNEKPQTPLKINITDF